MAFGLLLVYELVMSLFDLDGLSFFKLALTGFVWGSFGIAFYLFFTKYKVLKRNLPSFVFWVFWLMIAWNVISILRSLVQDVGSIVTLFGNVYTALSLLVPFVIIYAIDQRNILRINNILIQLLKFGMFMLVLFFVFRGGNFMEGQTMFLFILFQPTFFLITLWLHQGNKNKMTVLLAILLLAYVGSLFSNRTTFIRELMLLLGLLTIGMYQISKGKWMLRLAFVSIFIPFLLLQQSIATGISAFEVYLSTTTDDELSVDTRTFLYTELYEDLVENNELLIGKSANGKYYSEYFSVAEGDAEYRLDMEVGVLAIMLKGGLIAVVLNLMIFISAIYLAFFKANNSYVIGVGFMLLVHTLLLFVDNRIGYTSYNFLIWFFVGVCSSKNIRQMHDIEIRNIFKTKGKFI